ncbi:MAG: NADH dehydrogenase (quinone) subunit D, partial [Limnochordales bacterium]
MSQVIRSGDYDLDLQELQIDGEGDRMTLSVGPHHPSTHGVLRVVLEIEGERIVKATPEIGFLHTGIEKTAEHLTWTQAITVIDRMDYLAPMSNNLGYVLAVEKLLGIEVPARARIVRVLLTELQRIASHLVWLGTTALDIGSQSVLMYAFDLREGILDLFEEVAGARMHQSYFRVGGLAQDIPEGFEDQVRRFLDRVPERMREIRAILDENPIWLDRLKGVGAISADKAIALGVTGPNLRACGVPYDVRKAFPYAGYDEFEFDVPVAENGDCYDRYIVRVEEIMESYRICRQALARLPGGPVVVDDRKIVLPPKPEVRESMEALIHHFKLVSYGFDVPAGEVYQALESPRGEIGFYVVSNGKNKPWRGGVRGP